MGKGNIRTGLQHLPCGTCLRFIPPATDGRRHGRYSNDAQGLAIKQLIG